MTRPRAMDDADDYIRRVNLAIAGYERGEHVSTWIVKEHLKESIELLREMGEEIERLKKSLGLAIADRDAAYLKGLDTAKAAVEAEPEYPGEMPDQMWCEVRNNQANMSEALRITVRLTKAGIISRIDEAKGK